MKQIISVLLLTVFFAATASMLLPSVCQAQNPISREKKENPKPPVKKPMKEQPKHNSAPKIKPNTSPTPELAPEVKEPEVKVPDARTSYRSMDLQARRNGKYYYFNPDEWGALSAAQKALFTKDGVVMKIDNEAFVVALYDKENGKRRYWDEAMILYGDNLPTKVQGEIMVKYKNIMNERIKAYCGQIMDSWYWTRTEDDPSSAWLVFMDWGYVYSSSKTTPYRVRAVAPVPVASAR